MRPSDALMSHLDYTIDSHNLALEWWVGIGTPKAFDLLMHTYHPEFTRVGARGRVSTLAEVRDSLAEAGGSVREYSILVEGLTVLAPATVRYVEVRKQGDAVLARRLVTLVLFEGRFYAEHETPLG